MDTKAIRTKVLDLAVRGMLTRRRPDDGAAEDLLAQIQTEKQALIAAGRIKREKPLLEITEEEKPFEVPEQWKWVRLGDYVVKVTDQVASGSFAALRENVVSKKLRTMPSWLKLPISPMVSRKTQHIQTSMGMNSWRIQICMVEN